MVRLPPCRPYQFGGKTVRIKIGRPGNRRNFCCRFDGPADPDRIGVGGVMKEISTIRVEDPDGASGLDPRRLRAPDTLLVNRLFPAGSLEKQFDRTAPPASFLENGRGQAFQ